MYKIIIILLIGTKCFSQGHIDHIKTQPYLEIKLDCNCLDCDNDDCSTTFHSRYCNNIAFQKSDSLLTIVYEDLKNEMKLFGGKSQGDSIVSSFEGLQKQWRNLRQQNCTVVWNKYEGCGGCNTRAADYLSCLKTITDIRTESLKRFLTVYKNKILIIDE